MSEELWFSQNNRDLSVWNGDDAGFEFEFYCQRCGDTWRSGFENYTLGRASGWLRRASSMAGGLMSNTGWEAANVAGGLADAGWHKARDAALQRAIVKAQQNFHRCARCHQQVCGACWSADRGLCMNCAPNLQAEVEQARAEGEVQAARQMAHDAGVQLAQGLDVQTERQLVCQQCGAQTHGGKFCPECGHALGGPANCHSCGEAVPAGAKFCPECGAAAN